MEDIKQFLNENQNPKAVENAVKKVTGLLTREETIMYVAVQKKPLFNFSPDCIALTNKRMIICRPKNLGFSMDFQDFMWKEIVDSHIKERFWGATFMIITTNNYSYTIDYLPKAQARLLYRFAQEREEDMSEYRRQQKLENTRAAAGGVVVKVNEEKKIQMSSTDDAIGGLKKLKELLDNQLINQEEFDTKKAALLSKI